MTSLSPSFPFTAPARGGMAAPVNVISLAAGAASISELAARHIISAGATGSRGTPGKSDHVSLLGGSSVVESGAVNALVAGSNPARPAILINTTTFLVAAAKLIQRHSSSSSFVTE